MTGLPPHRCPACFRAKGQGAVCDHCGWRPGASVANPLYLAPGTPLGDSYIIGRVLGHGGLGITYLAWDLELETRIAIKEFLPDTMAGRNLQDGQVTIHTGHEEPFRRALERFRDEARILARFQQHPGIVSVYRFLAANGTGYMVMEFVAGRTLRQYLEERGGRIPWREALDLLTPAMDTLARIHDAGLLHRDIAPDNLYITHDGAVKLLDFGAARETAGGRSVSFSVVLKESYAPEEQYRRKGKQGPWTDIYALCATLYRAVTGRLPPTALDRGFEDELQPPSALGIDIPEDHQAVLMKGLAIHQQNRWQTIGEMRDAWGRNATEPEPKPPKSEPPKPDKHTRYGTWIALFTAVVTALMLVLELTDKIDLTGAAPQTPPASPPVLLADAADADTGTPPASSGAHGSLPRGIPDALEPPTTPDEVAPKPKPEPEPPSATLTVAPDPPDAMVTVDGKPLDPDAAHLLAPGEYDLRVARAGYQPFEKQVRLAAGESLDLPVRLAPRTARLVVRANVVGDRLFIDGQPVGATGPESHELAPGKHTIRVEKEGYAPFETQLELAPGGRETVRATLERIAPDYADWRKLRTIKAHPGGREGAICWDGCIRFAPDGRRLLSGSFDDTLKLWDATTGRAMRVFRGHEGDVWSVALSPDGSRALSGSSDDTLRLWDVATGREVRAFRGHRGSVRSVAFSPDGRRALSGSDDNTLRLWDAATGREIRAFRGHESLVLSVAFSPDGRQALSGGGRPYSQTLGRCYRARDARIPGA
uniref:Serine/threonine protein kinase n=1 Tax=Candidatus Kentrum sp. FM TaxID=2126340 RepID=A0A450S8G3_9GAMM|nr:MAG: Serine/threonine protein kinase [Candidatus Kentron sp. FM]VFJ48217.1 MAG: Serine/threonine protein kinase [Candidatus Kentron sp. FM]VFK07531.1 MAG: Serine/threonine protein kinase [Candidatus Kentron sp. FM]